MSTTSLTPSRALRRPRRIDVRAIFGVVLMLAAVAGSVLFWGASSDSRPVLVATRDLPAMAVLGAADLTVAHVRVDDAMYLAAVPAAELTALIGKPLAEPVHAQQMLLRAQLAQRPPLGVGQTAFTIAINPETAVGGRLRPGDQVQVFVTLNKGKPDTRSTVVLPRVTVYDVGYESRLAAVSMDGSSGAANQGAAKWLTLIVTQEGARQLAQAKWNGDLDVALLPPER